MTNFWLQLALPIVLNTCIFSELQDQTVKGQARRTFDFYKQFLRFLHNFKVNLLREGLLLFSRQVVSDSVATPWFLCPWDFPGKNTGVGCHFLLQGIFPTSQGLNPRLLHWQVDSLPLSHQGSPYEKVTQLKKKKQHSYRQLRSFLDQHIAKGKEEKINIITLVTCIFELCSQIRLCFELTGT